MSKQFHVILFPFMAHGHMIPTADIAKLLAARSVKVSIISTPVNAVSFSKAIETGEEDGNSLINIQIFKFPWQEVGLPEGCETAELVMKEPEMVPKFFQATDLLREQLEQYLEMIQPECLIADMIYPWATDCAAKFNVPRLVFHGISYFAMCAQEIVRLYEPYKNVSSDDQTFVLPSIPHEIKLVRTQINPELMDEKNESIRKRMELIKESEVRSYGVIVNSFYELEPEYADYFKAMGRKTWHIGPVSLFNKSVLQKSQRGKQASINEHDCLAWLDSKTPNSVIYVCFGSMVLPFAPQLHEIAIALQRCGKHFIWVIRDGNNDDLLQAGFEERTRGKGLIIRGWAPQILILDHMAVGAFLTHCGWNSTLEGISAGVPMVTWPTFGEQFYNEKLVTDVLRIGVSVGVKRWSRQPSADDVICRETIEMAIKEIMEGDKAEAMRHRAKQLKVTAAKAVEEGGSSYSDLTAFISELKGFQASIQ